jgi:ornithine carbamoyltransferase
MSKTTEHKAISVWWDGEGDFPGQFDGGKMKGKDFLSISDLAPDEVAQMVQQAHDMKTGERPRLLEGKVFALVFEKPSLRTRVSFEVGIRQMGGSCVYLSSQDVGLGVREPEADVARVLDRWVEGIIARVYSHKSLEILARYTSIPVINALSDLEHPCQIIGDMLTIQEHKGALDGLRIAFIGDGNNVASSLALACASVGADFTLASPKDYQIPGVVLEEAKRRAALKESRIDWVKEPATAVKDADVVYTDTWVSMGHEAEKEERVKVFKDYHVDEELVKGAKPDFLFMHDMPAYRGQEISDGMIDHPRSVVFDQAENRLHAQNAILASIFSRR